MRKRLGAMLGAFGAAAPRFAVRDQRLVRIAQRSQDRHRSDDCFGEPKMIRVGPTPRFPTGCVWGELQLQTNRVADNGGRILVSRFPPLREKRKLGSERPLRSLTKVLTRKSSPSFSLGSLQNDRRTACACLQFLANFAQKAGNSACNEMDDDFAAGGFLAC